jgi:hypothetical protein
MRIKGEYRDILSRNGEVIVDTGWQSNDIVADYGRFLAALMKKDFEGLVGIDYMAVGGGSGNYVEFKDRVEAFFDSLSPDQLPTPEPGDNWVGAKKIEPDWINYLDEEGNVVDDSDENITNRLRIEVTFGKEEEGEQPEPSEETLEFKEFALLGIDKNSGGTFDTDKLFFINYVDHGLITKDKSMVLTRTVILKFPVKEEVVP